MKLFFLVLLLLGVCSGTTWAKTFYISDQLVVSLRNLPIDGSEVVEYLKTDTPLEFIDESGDFFQVKTTNQTIGFVKKRYLTETPPKSSTIQQLRQENDSLRGEVDALKKKVVSLQVGERNTYELQTKIKEIEAEKRSIEQAFLNFKQKAEHVDEIVLERDRLKKENNTISSQLDSLTAEQESALSDQSISWFLAGAGVLFFGWLLGRKSRKRYSYIR